MIDTLDELFEPITEASVLASLDYACTHTTLAKATMMADRQLDDLRSDGTITDTQAGVVRGYFPYCRLKDLLDFALGYKGLLSGAISNYGLAKR